MAQRPTRPSSWKVARRWGKLNTHEQLRVSAGRTSNRTRTEELGGLKLSYDVLASDGLISDEFHRFREAPGAEEQCQKKDDQADPALARQFVREGRGESGLVFVG